jgi:hypothetical protein
MHPRNRTRTPVAWRLPALALVVGLCAAASAVASAAGGRSTGDPKQAIKLIGAPALLDAAGVTDSTKRHYVAAIRLVNSSDEWQEVLVGFNVTKGSKALYSRAIKQTVQPGEGLALIPDSVLQKGIRSVNAVLLAVNPAPRDELLASFRLVGKPKLRNDGGGTCSWHARVKNPKDEDADIENELYFVALLRGKIVSAGSAALTFDVKARATSTVFQSYLPCAKKVDAVRAYFQNT